MTTTQNHHAELAQNWGGLEEGDRAVEATLAVAYEQRTANLIALWSNPETTLTDLKTGRPRSCGVGTDVMDTVLAQIIERLGLQ